MAIQTVRRQWTGVVERVLRPIDLLKQLIARLSGWLNQERWTNLLTLLALMLGNLVILYFFLQGQDNRAIAFVVLALIAPFAFLIPELSIVAFICAGAGLFVNAMYFAIGPGGGTGERTLILTFFTILTIRAIYEYIRTPATQRPKLFSWFTMILVFFWIYYLIHVMYIYLFRYHEYPPDSIDAVFGIYQKPIFRYFDYHMIWIGIFPLIILMRHYQRAKRVFILLMMVMALGIVAIIWDYFAPLPDFFKVLFQLRASGVDVEGYRIRDPASLYLFLVGFFGALYALGYVRGWLNVAIGIYIGLALIAILVTKNRALWAGIAIFLPVALLWKSPNAILKQAQLLMVAALFLSAIMLHPKVSEPVSQILHEAMQRWARNYAYGGDPRLDPSYQMRVRELEAFRIHWEGLPTFQKLFGAGLEATYGFYVPLSYLGFRGPRFERLYIEKVYMHFSWMARLHHIGYIGLSLLALTLVAFLIRAMGIFVTTHNILARILLVGAMGSTISMIAFDFLHQTLDSSAAVPVVMLWSLAELVPHWQRTGQLPSASAAASIEA
ncbi:hypothetical protein HRbin15_02197 [bacterium HR15]|nr:hypothetical protein HRbin15_02197 [bacterium HR15]